MTHSLSFLQLLECPICYNFMFKSVIMSDGNFVHEKCIRQFYTKNQETRSFITNEPLESKQLIPNIQINIMIKDLIETTDFLDEHILDLTTELIMTHHIFDIVQNSKKMLGMIDNEIIINCLFTQLIDAMTKKDEPETLKIMTKFSSPSTLLDNMDNNLLHLACSFKLPTIITHILQNYNVNINGLNKNNCTPLIIAAFNGMSDVVDQLLNFKGIEIAHISTSGHNAFLWSIKNKLQKTSLKFLEFDNIDVNQGDNLQSTPLMLAAYHDQSELVEKLLAHPNIKVNLHDVHGDTAAMYACYTKRTKIALDILEHKDIDINCVGNQQMTVLLWALTKQLPNVVLKILTFNDLDINHADHEGETALIKACRFKMEQIADLILDIKNIDIKPVNGKGETAQSYANRNDMFDVLCRMMNMVTE